MSNLGSSGGRAQEATAAVRVVSRVAVERAGGRRNAAVAAAVGRRFFKSWLFIFR